MNSDKAAAKLNKPKGITNGFGASCYMSAVLQIWFHNPRFYSAVLNDVKPKKLLNSLQKLFQELNSSICRAVNLENFVELYQFQPGSQEDPLEFMKKFFGKLKEDGNWSENISEEFIGTYTSSIRCSGCDQSVTNEFSEFEFLNLTRTAENSLDYSLESFVKTEVITDRWLCKFCQSHNQKIHKMVLHRFPRTLWFQIAMPSDIKGRKTTSEFCLQDRIDMSKYFSEEKESLHYVLKAIIDHRGRKITHGHFVAKIKIDSEWFEFDDTSVKKIATPGIRSSGESHTSKDVYVLVYEQLEGATEALPETTNSTETIVSVKKKFKDYFSQVRNIKTSEEAQSSQKFASSPISKAAIVGAKKKFHNFFSNVRNRQKKAIENSSFIHVTTESFVDCGRRRKRKEFNFAILEYDTLHDLQLRILEEFNVPLDKQRLVFEGEDVSKMDNNQTIGSIFGKEAFVQLEIKE